MAESLKWLNEKCYTCNRRMNSWDKRLTKAFKVRNTCEDCFCSIYDLDKEVFRGTMEDYFGIRPCQGI